jgi:uncharacterized protein (TIGR00369 family)
VAVTQYEALNSEFEARVRDSFSRQRAMATIGAHLLEVKVGEVAIGLPYREDLTQQHGFIHGGIVGIIADNACGYSAFTLLPPDSTIVTVEYKLNLLSPAEGERLIARGRVVKSGRTLVIAEARVAAVRQGRESEIAVCLATLMTLNGRADAPRAAHSPPDGVFASRPITARVRNQSSGGEAR